MVSLIPYDKYQSKDLNYNLPIEIRSMIVDYINRSNYVAVIRERNGFSIIDINTKELIKRIDTFKLNHMSTSKCGNFIAGSDETRVCIWNLKTGELIKTIEVDFNPIYDPVRDEFLFMRSIGNGEPVHTFTHNNELLVASNTQIKSYAFQNNDWVEKNVYHNESQIVIISANQSNNLFACGSLWGDVYVYNYDTKEKIYEFTTRQPLMRTDSFPEITCLTFNNNILIVSSVGTNNILFDTDTGNQIKIEQPRVRYPGSYFDVKNYMLTPCNTKFVGSFNGYTFEWNAITGKVIRQLDVNINIYNNSVLTPDGAKIVIHGLYSNINSFGATHKDIHTHSHFQVYNYQ